MAEFYVHNLMLTNLDILYPNPTMGDIQLTAMVNEDTREKEIWRVMGRRNKEPLYIRPELFSPKGVILNRQEFGNKTLICRFLNQLLLFLVVYSHCRCCMGVLQIPWVELLSFLGSAFTTPLFVFSCFS